MTTTNFATRLADLGIAAPVSQHRHFLGELIDANGVSLLQIDTVGIRENADVKAIADLVAEAINAWYEKVSAELDGKPAEDDDDTERCIACDLPIEDGDPVYNDADGGFIHAACAGTDRASFTGPDGEPLKDGEPIPEPWIWRSDETAVIDELLRDDPDLDHKSAVALIAEAEAEAAAGGL